MTIHKLSPEQRTLVEKWLDNDRRRVEKSAEINRLYDLMVKTKREVRRYEIRSLQGSILNDLRILAKRQSVLADEMVKSGVTMNKALAAYKRATS
jgi:hypothetical protein